ncbi:MAG: 6-phosphogluconolactonase [Pirellula sp.]|jgi:6-phosphogluconolactonase|nr:6-phosphogluconolactonase [Pirellula sp.]
MSTQIIIKRNPDEVASAVAEWLIDSIRGVLQVRPACSIALSGGSTPKRLYELIAANELHCLDWSRVMLFWGDERNVPADHSDSNYRMVREAWLDRALASRESRCIPRFFPVPVQPSTPERSAREYSEMIREALSTDRANETIPRIDMVLLGLGDDSHTASLFPETLALQEEDEIFVANFVPKFDAYRLTMTVPMINAARQVAFLVCGSSKQAAIDVVWHGPRQGTLYPAQLIQPQQGELFWFLDTAALPEHRKSDYQP